jgi:hypothetical protein
MSTAQETPVPVPSQATPPALSKPKLPGVREVIDQVVRDLFGKDVQDTATFSYEWVADQFGHFALGFEITLALSWIATLLGYRGGRVGFWIGLAVVLVFVVKEADDFRREWAKARTAKSVFQFNALEIFYNTFTAVFYIALGAVVAGFGLLNPAFGLIAIPVTAVPALALGYAWLRRKLTFQQAGLPYLYRLANFPNPIPRATAEFIVGLSKPSPTGAAPALADHLLIAGPLESGKSSLAIGIGTEFAIRMGIGRYTTLTKLLEAVLKKGEWDKPEFDDGRILWPWQTSDLLIVDDVDVLSDDISGKSDFSARSATVETARRVAQCHVDVLRERIPAVLLDALKYRRTVWVVGDIDDGELKRWQGLIAGLIGVPTDRVRTLRFDQKIRDLDPQRPMPTAAQQVRQ